MSKILVMYGTYYGTAKQYTEWIAQRLGAKLIEVSQIEHEELDEYRTVIYAGGLYAGGMVGNKYIKKYASELKDKKIAICTVGMASIDDTDKFKSIIANCIPKELQEGVKVFHLRGGMDYSKMSFKHRMMMKAMVTMLKNKKEPLDEDDKGVIETYGKEVSFMDEGSIEPIIQFVDSEQNN